MTVGEWRLCRSFLVQREAGAQASTATHERDQYHGAKHEPYERICVGAV